MHFARPATGWSLQPLDTITVHDAPGVRLVVRDGEGRIYARLPVTGPVEVLVGGSLGAHRIDAHGDDDAVLASLSFEVDCASGIDDRQGVFQRLFGQCVRSMEHENKPEGVGATRWRGKLYHWFVPWVLDHVHTAKGQQYLRPQVGELIEVFAAVQRADGLIWSFGFQTQAPEYGYHYWAYKDRGYAMVDGDVLFARQPVEQHCEYNFVDGIYLQWKASGDDAWMRRHLSAGVRALDYTLSAPGRFSSRFRLLKRGCTIDSWDFQAKDRYAVDLGLGGDMLIDPERTTFVVFFGDNHGYAHACDQLAEMLDRADQGSEAGRFRQRGIEIRQRTASAAWNGRFFQHHVEDDPATVRDFGVDEREQVVMSNAYALNRNIDHEQAVAILRTYQHLREHLPRRAPAEWYAIYPPFERGFGEHNGKWQYMNAGVQAHMAGELARGACEHGFEAYGADILQRISELAQRTDGVVHFAYTGAWEVPPPPPVYTPIDLAAHATMDLWDRTSANAVSWMGESGGNDMRGLPVGTPTLAGIPWRIADPERNQHRSAVAVAARRARLPQRIEIPIGGSCATLHLLHAVNAIGPSGIAATLEFHYQDGDIRMLYLQAGKHLAGWWFPGLSGPDAGVAWRGANGAVGDVGVFWAAVANPRSEARLERLVVRASDENATYALIGLTLADRPHFHEPGAISYGGPDCWSGGLVLHALMQGLAGIQDADCAYRQVRLSPRWCAAGTREVTATARYGGHAGYCRYRYRHLQESRSIELAVTGSGEGGQLRVLLPAGAVAVVSCEMDGSPVTSSLERIEESRYAVLPIVPARPARISVVYR